jgi:hypothetical protein
MKKNKSYQIYQRTEYFFSIIVNELKKFNPESIIVYGSYGRNEGAWIAEGATYKPYNDFDIVVVSNDNISKSIIDKAVDSIKLKTGVEWIDLQFFSSMKLKKLSKKTMFNYDLKFGSKIIYGNKKILENIPIKKSDSINIKDLEVLFNTRLWALYASFNDLKNLNEEESLLFRYQMSKAILASVESHLIRNNHYFSSYNLKVEKYLKISNKNHKLVKWALQQKFNPYTSKIKFDEAQYLLNETKDIFFNEFFKSLSIIYKKDIISVNEILVFRSSLRNKLKSIGKYILLREHDIFKRNSVRQLELILSISNDNDNFDNYEPFFSNNIKHLSIEYQNSFELKQKISKMRFGNL